jgi:putative PIN family toxin of toxin-antitoxin system
MRPRVVVLDTNVLISAILFGGPPKAILDLVVTGYVSCAVSAPILEELRDVLTRSKFGFSAEQAFQVVEELMGLCCLVSPNVRIDCVAADPDDDRILECTVEARADAIVSGDEHLVALERYRAIPILSPAAFLDNYTEFRRS